MVTARNPAGEAGAAGAAAAPATLAEAAGLLRESAAAVVFRGGGTKAYLTAGTSPVTVSTRSLTGIVLHDPLDGVAVVRAGTPLAQLQAELAPHGQWLAIDPPFSDRGATVGGIFSSNDAGPRRLAYGTLRDLVIGATVVTGDGVVARSGGRVIKNVAGFDLARLYCGAFGTLGLVAELALRLHPLRSASRTLEVICPLDSALEIAQAVRAAGLTPTALDWISDGLAPRAATGGAAAAGSLLVRFEERSERATAAQTGELHGLCEQRRLAVTTLEGDAELQAWAGVDRLLAGEGGDDGGGDAVLRAVTRPSRVVSAARSLGELAGESATGCRFASHVLVGVHTACLGGPMSGTVGSAWRSAVEQLGGHVTVRRASAEAGEIERWGPAPGAKAIMRRLKSELDPGNRCAPGTFVGGI